MMKKICVIVAFVAITNSLAVATQLVEFKEAELKYSLEDFAVPAIQLLETESLVIPENLSSGNQISGRAIVYTSGDYSANAYPSSDFVTYGTYCDFVGYDIYQITGVSNLMKCGVQFCAGDRRCTHFTFRESDGLCQLKTNYGAGSGWVQSSSTNLCGLIPNRACGVNMGTLSNFLLGCLSLSV